MKHLSPHSPTRDCSVGPSAAAPMNVWPNTKSTSSSALYPNLSSGRTELCPEAEQQRQTGGWRQEAAGHQEGGRTRMRMAATGREVKTRLQQSRNRWIRERRRGGGGSGGGRDGGRGRSGRRPAAATCCGQRWRTARTARMVARRRGRERTARTGSARRARMDGRGPADRGRARADGARAAHGRANGQTDRLPGRPRR